MVRALLLLAALAAPPAGPAAAPMATVGPGVYRPVYPPTPEEKEIPVERFLLDVVPATNADWLAFVEANPKWRRGAASRLFVDEGYLRHWAGPLDPGADAPDDWPVVNVSWHAARAYCAWREKRLPTTTEWEFAAAATETQADGRDDPEFRKRILAWYTQPASRSLRRVGMGAANAWGARDLHGLVWEWVDDFNSTLVGGDNREQGGADSFAFCGAGALNADEREDYAAFMRIAFRSSLRGDFTVASLGCRCAAPAPEDKP